MKKPFRQSLPGLFHQGRWFVFCFVATACLCSLGATKTQTKCLPQTAHPSPDQPRPSRENPSTHSYGPAPTAQTCTNSLSETYVYDAPWVSTPSPRPIHRHSLIPALLPLLVFRRSQRKKSLDRSMNSPSRPANRNAKCAYSHQPSARHQTAGYHYDYRQITVLLWPSRDPIEERGGVNLYGMVGNDAVGLIDLVGLCVACGDESNGQAEGGNQKKPDNKPLTPEEQAAAQKKCGELLEEAKKDPEYIRLKKILDKHEKCSVMIGCVCCKGKPIDRLIPFGISGVATPGPDGNGGTMTSILICADRSSDLTSVKRSLIHEMTHALQNCKGVKTGFPQKIKPSTCDDCLCRELQAYATDPAWSGNLKDPKVILQLKMAAATSCFQRDLKNPKIRIGPCKNHDMTELFNMGGGLYDECTKKIPNQ